MWLEKVSCMSSNGPPGNCCGVLKEYLIRHVLRGQNGGSTSICLQVEQRKRIHAYMHTYIHTYIYIMCTYRL